MSGGGNRRANGERGAEKSMDDYLKSLGLHRKSIAKDGSCLFRAVAEQVLFSQSLHTRVRAHCVKFLRQHRDNYEAFIEGDFEDYLCKLLDPKQWVGEVEINALSLMYKRDFFIFQEPGKLAVNITENNFEDKVHLCFLNGNHYDSVYPITQMRSAAVCQSILYELLYENVFAVDSGVLGPSLKSNRTAHLVSDDNMAPCVSSDDSDAEITEAPKGEKDTVTTGVRHGSQSWRGRGRGRLPERVRRSLNPSLFRNVEYDVWHKSLKAQQKRDYCIAAGMQYSVGDRCQAVVDGNGYCNAVIKEIHADVGEVTVETEKLGQVRVSLWNLQSHSTQNTSLKAVTRSITREKKPANGHGGEWEERRRGRGRGRGATASSVPSAAAPGSVGRTVKQHSWPAQTAAEDRGGQRVSRLSSGDADSVSFGLTEEERQAKQEAEKNVALVELHLRDESSFPALSSNGATKHSGERKQSQRRNTKSPVESLQAPSAGEGLKSSPLPDSTATLSANTDRGAPLLSRNEKSPNSLDSIKVATTASTSPSQDHSAGAASVADPKTSDAPRSIKAVSSSPAALRPASLPSPTFIAPIAPDLAVALGFHRSSSHPHSPLPHSPSPPALISPSTEGLPSKVISGASASPPVTNVVESQTGSHHPSSPLQNQTKSAVNHSSPVRPDHQVLASVLPAQNEGKAIRPSADQPLQSASLASPNQTQSPASSTRTQIQADAMPLNTHLDSQEEVGNQQNQVPFSQIQPSLLPTPNPLNQPEQQTAAHSISPDVQHRSEALVAQTKPEGQELDPSLPELHHQSQAAPVLVDDTAQQEQPPLCSTVEGSQTPPMLPSVPGSQPYPQLPSALPLLSHPDVQGSVPLQQLSQLYQDPLYPGFPQEANGNMAQIPPYSSRKSGEDLPRDVNILRFFFNLGVKAFKNSMYQPCVYLLPLQQAFNLHLNPPSSTANFLHAIPPAEHQGAYHPQQHQFIPEPQYSPQIPPQSLPAEPSNPSESARYPVNQPATHAVPGSLLPWQPPHPKRQLSPSYPASYATQSHFPDPVAQVYQRGGQAVYSPAMSSYAPPSHHYQSPNTPGEPQGAAEPSRQNNGASILGPGHSPVSGALEHSAAGFHSVDPRALKNEQNGMRLMRVEPQFEQHRKPPPVSYHDIAMTTIPRSGNAPGSPAHYFMTEKSVTLDSRQSFAHPSNKTYIPHKSHQPGSRMNHATVGFTTDDSWCQPGGITSLTWSNQTAKRGPRPRGGRRGRGGPWRGDGASGYSQFSTYPGRGQDRE
ncbi:OTU domain-containing protein 4 [Synchiropus picturatus]